MWQLKENKYSSSSATKLCAEVPSCAEPQNDPSFSKQVSYKLRSSERRWDIYHSLKTANEQQHK